MAKDSEETIIQADPSSIFEKLCEVIENTNILKHFHEASLDYVTRWHNPLYVANITKSVYEN